tara:strand:- start:597 stop:1658 length:1062 start_codon:yes stop_codon:yes gene_type:complete
LQAKYTSSESRSDNSAVLIINLGTPNAPNTQEVRTYLRELLSSDRVLDINPFLRWLLLNIFILPFRPKKTAKAYKKIWLEEGSPLMVYSKKLKKSLTEQFTAENIHVELGMQCGEPSIKNALDRLRALQCSRIIVLPMYPQYASSTFGGAIEDLYREVINDWNMPQLQIIPPFFSDSLFIGAWAKVGLPYIDHNPDHVLFSFHGLPIRHLKKSDISGNWCKNNKECCLILTNQNKYCYSAHCHETSKLIAEKLNLDKEKWSVSFQSRFGREEWVKPYTEQHLKELAQRGIKRVVVFCPSFVSDCLETLEEIGIQAAENFQKCGGEELLLVPSLNDHPEWIKSISSIVRNQLPR